MSQDPVFWTTEKQKEQLRDPQLWNSYSYSRGNPIRYKDQDGESLVNALFFGKYANEQDQQDLGMAVDYQYNNSATWKTALDHPVATGVTVAVGGTGVAALIAPAATAVSINALAGAGTACVAMCDKGQKALNLINSNTILSSAERQLVSNTIQNNGLRNEFLKLFQSTDTLAKGTAGAIEHTRLTGQLVGGSDHIIKGTIVIKTIQNIMDRTSLSKIDTKIANTLMKQIANALDK